MNLLILFIVTTCLAADASWIKTYSGATLDSQPKQVTWTSFDVFEPQSEGRPGIYFGSTETRQLNATIDAMAFAIEAEILEKLIKEPHRDLQKLIAITQEKGSLIGKHSVDQNNESLVEQSGKLKIRGNGSTIRVEPGVLLKEGEVIVVVASLKFPKNSDLKGRFGRLHIYPVKKYEFQYQSADCIKIETDSLDSMLVEQGSNSSRKAFIHKVDKNRFTAEIDNILESSNTGVIFNETNHCE